jgi:excisionase family DNA binding protein
MTILVDGKKFYLTSEACALVGISRDTFLRWVRTGSFTDVKHRDFRGWRLFTDDDLVRLKTKLNRIALME